MEDMRIINKVFLGGGIIALIIIAFIISGILLSPDIEPLSFSIDNRDFKNHRVTVEIFDSTNKSLFNKTYEMNPRETAYYSGIAEKKGEYTFKVTLNDKIEMIYKAEVGVAYSSVSIWLYDEKISGSEYPIYMVQAIS